MDGVLVLFLMMTSFSASRGSEVFNIKHLGDINEWEKLAPGLHISDKSFQIENVESWFDDITTQTEREMLDRILIEGYFQLPPQQYNLPFQDMTDLMDKLHEMSLPVVFCFIYDEFWLPFLRVDGLMKRVLGDGYLKLPDFWAWRIDPTTGESGWEPHLDKKSGALFDNGMPRTFSLWIPLSDATVDNGCMYVLPADRDPTYTTDADSRESLQNIHWADFIMGLRALPAEAGSVLGWNSNVWHYGSQSNRRAEGPRYSVSFEFQSGATTLLTI
jgi:hypothetical protein